MHPLGERLVVQSRTHCGSKAIDGFDAPPLSHSIGRAQTLGFQLLFERASLGHLLLVVWLHRAGEWRTHRLNRLVKIVDGLCCFSQPA